MPPGGGPACRLTVRGGGGVAGGARALDLVGIVWLRRSAATALSAAASSRAPRWPWREELSHIHRQETAVGPNHKTPFSICVF